MPALSFQGEWLDKLLSGSKQQTTRQQTDRIKVGDVVHIYNQQRRRIIDKPIMELTCEGCDMMEQRIKDMNYPLIPFYNPMCEYALEYYAHFLGKVVITEVYDLHPYETPLDELGEWAHADGFDTFETADVWFTKQYGEEWDLKPWTVIRWQGWQARYFEPDGRKS